MAAHGLVISTEYSAQELRGLARAEVNRRAALRMLAIANALDGLARAEAGRLRAGLRVIHDAGRSGPGHAAHQRGDPGESKQR